MTDGKTIEEPMTTGTMTAIEEKFSGPHDCGPKRPPDFSLGVMNTYRKKPIVIEAFQFFGNDYWDIENPQLRNAWPVWAQRACGLKNEAEGAIWAGVVRNTKDYGKFFCGTLEGRHEISEGDWVIRGVKGEIYPCKPDIFEATYETAIA